MTAKRRLKNDVAVFFQTIILWMFFVFLCFGFKMTWELFYHENTKKRDFLEVALNHSSGIDYDDFMKIDRKCTNEI